MHMFLWCVSDLFHPDDQQLFSVIGQEGSHVGQERRCQQTVSHKVSHVFFKTLKHRNPDHMNMDVW